MFLTKVGNLWVFCAWLGIAVARLFPPWVDIGSNPLPWAILLLTGYLLLLLGPARETLPMKLFVIAAVGCLLTMWVLPRAYLSVLVFCYFVAPPLSGAACALILARRQQKR